MKNNINTLSAIDINDLRNVCFKQVPISEFKDTDTNINDKLVVIITLLNTVIEDLRELTHK